MHLSPKQQQIFSLIVEGCCSKEIAKRLQMSDRTVESHLQRLYDKHGVHNRAALVAKWLIEGGRPCDVPGNP
ncbi:response regulator transcription factor [Peterkaempfera bronchialis]|uniref:LuxR family transcriptional regulator n=1 Tax=Peterkaempfera bronchialis TaxID=2126346 RepID=A0A345T285_9ACTN|nr:helix-turn-helix transcriptional regulator [Peterkaempfera bronchialis]AXI80090.1 LuxR family transcriptional regulator [Peterkaempfera bronchialis]